MISAVGVAVPARNEQHLIGACIRHLLSSLRKLPPSIERAVCVLADRCTDKTAWIARAEFGGWSAARVVENRRAGTIGEVRDLSFQQVRSALSDRPSSRIWLLSTDADSTVALDWASEHLSLANRGIHAIAGVTELADNRPLPAAVAASYAAIVDAARQPNGHGNVYAANLGVRGDAYRAVGGFGSVSSGEDHELWRRLGQAGYRRHYAAGPRVTTSARQDGRAPAGLAALLRELQRQSQRPPGYRAAG